MEALSVFRAIDKDMSGYLTAGEIHSRLSDFGMLDEDIEVLEKMAQVWRMTGRVFGCRRCTRPLMRMAMA